MCRKLLTAALAFVLLGGAAWAGPAPVVFSQTLGKMRVQMQMPPGATLPTPQPKNGVKLYKLMLADPSGKAKLQVMIQTQATSAKVPQNDQQVHHAMAAMIKSTGVSITDQAIKYEMITNANASYDVVYGGFYEFKGKSGEYYVLSPNILIGKKKEVAVPITVAATILSKNASKADIEQTKNYLQAAVKGLITSATLTK